MNYTCDACGSSAEHDPSKGHLPLGWRLQWIAERMVTLCDACSFLCPPEGPSRLLVDMLRLRGVDVNTPDW